MPTHRSAVSENKIYTDISFCTLPYSFGKFFTIEGESKGHVKNCEFHKIEK